MAFSAALSVGASIPTPGFVKFVPNPKGIAALGVSPQMVLMLQEKAQKAADAAIQAWHMSGPHPYETGTYVGSIKGEAGILNGRAVGRLNAYDFKAYWLEFGTSDTPAFSSLRRGTENSGLHLSNEVRRGSG